MSGTGYTRMGDATSTTDWSDYTFTWAVIYDASPRTTAIDYIRASNAWPSPYPGILWAGTLDTPVR
jgi:hypothetical protein